MYDKTHAASEDVRRTVAWERRNPPEELNAEDCDCDAEDAALAASALSQRPPFEASSRFKPKLQARANGTLVGRQTEKRIRHR